MRDSVTFDEKCNKSYNLYEPLLTTNAYPNGNRLSLEHCNCF